MDRSEQLQNTETIEVGNDKISLIERDATTLKRSQTDAYYALSPGIGITNDEKQDLVISFPEYGSDSDTTRVVKEINNFDGIINLTGLGSAQRNRGNDFLTARVGFLSEDAKIQETKYIRFAGLQDVRENYDYMSPEFKQSIEIIYRLFLQEFNATSTKLDQIVGYIQEGVLIPIECVYTDGGVDIEGLTVGEHLTYLAQNFAGSLENKQTIKDEFLNPQYLLLIKEQFEINFQGQDLDLSEYEGDTYGATYKQEKYEAFKKEKVAQDLMSAVSNDHQETNTAVFKIITNKLFSNANGNNGSTALVNIRNLITHTRKYNNIKAYLSTEQHISDLTSNLASSVLANLLFVTDWDSAELRNILVDSNGKVSFIDTHERAGFKSVSNSLFAARYNDKDGDEISEEQYQSEINSSTRVLAMIQDASSDKIKTEENFPRDEFEMLRMRLLIKLEDTIVDEQKVQKVMNDLSSFVNTSKILHGKEIVEMIKRRMRVLRAKIK